MKAVKAQGSTSELSSGRWSRPSSKPQTLPLFSSTSIWATRSRPKSLLRKSTGRSRPLIWSFWKSPQSDGAGSASSACRDSGFRSGTTPRDEPAGRSMQYGCECRSEKSLGLGRISLGYPSTSKLAYNFSEYCYLWAFWLSTSALDGSIQV